MVGALGSKNCARNMTLTLPVELTGNAKIAKLGGMRRFPANR